jgi:hypothetical protein
LTVKPVRLGFTARRNKIALLRHDYKYCHTIGGDTCAVRNVVADVLGPASDTIENISNTSSRLIAVHSITPLRVSFLPDIMSCQPLLPGMCFEYPNNLPNVCWCKETRWTNTNSWVEQWQGIK